MKRKKRGLARRIVSITLALALVTTSVQVTVNQPKVVKAASTDSTMGETDILDETYIKDPNVLQFYKILANAQKKANAAELTKMSSMTAGEIITAYGSNSEYTQSVYGVYLTEYKGKIDFDGITVNDVSGIGWARAAVEIDLSSITAMTTVPADEFASCKMEKITLPSGVTSIGKNAFKSCLKLTTLVIGSGEDGVTDLTNVNTIGDSAFNGCESMSNVKFCSYSSANELKIGNYAFAACNGLQELSIPIKTAKNLGENAFENCSGLRKVFLENDLGYISNSLFKGAGAESFGLTLYVMENGVENADSDMTLPKNIAYIGDNAFEGAILRGLDLSACTKLTKINQYAFGGSYFYENIILPESLETIETMAFNGTHITNVTIPEKCINIEKAAFKKSSLRGITLPSSLKIIEEETFNDCEKLDGDMITIGASSQLEEIGKDAFAKCMSLGTTSFLKDLKNLTTINSGAFSFCYAYQKNDAGSLVRDKYGDYIVISGLRDIILPDCVTVLGESVFADDYALRTADLGTGVTNIPDKAFYNSTATLFSTSSSSGNGAGLETVIVSDKLQSVGASAFENQSKLHTLGYSDGTTETVEEGKVQFKSGLLSVGDKAFKACGSMYNFSMQGAKIYIKPENVHDTYEEGLSELLIYDYEDEDSNQYSLKTIFVNEADIMVKTTDETIPWDSYEIFVAAKKVYINTTNQKVKVTVNPPQYSTIDTYPLRYDNVTDDYKDRFYGTDTAATTVYYLQADTETKAVDDKITDPDYSAIYAAPNSGNLAAAKILNSSSATVSMKYMFGIEDVVLPDSLMDDNLGESAFEGCLCLNDVTLSKNLTEIKKSTFSGAGYEVPNSVNGSETAKYNDYKGLKTINIPDGITSIGEGAFQNCYNLTLATKGGSSFGTSVKEIAKNAFFGCYSLDTIKFPSTLETIGEAAFAECAIKELDKRVVTYVNSTSTYPYYSNRKTYGTREIKTGLTDIDFTAAYGLKTVGTGAFRQTNVVNINLTKSPLVTIPSRLFEQCSFLKTIDFQDSTESLDSNVLKDNLSLLSVSMPAKATLKKDSFSGAFAAFNASNPTLSFNFDKDDVITVPIGSSARLPINVINKDVINGEVKITIKDASGNDVSILNQEVNGIKAEVNTSSDPYSFVLYGIDYIKEPIAVTVTVGTGFSYANSSSYWISSHTMEFKVAVDDVATDKVSITAAEDATVKTNPNMYAEKDGSKTLYVPVTNTKGIQLKAIIDPIESTNDVSWECDNPCVELSDQQYEKGSGFGTVLVTPKEIGHAKITVKSGTKTDVIDVYSQIPVTSSSNIVCSTDGQILSTSLTPNTSNTAYGLSIKDSGKINVSVNYPGDYSAEQIEQYGEKFIFSSSDSEILSVSQDGTFTAIKEGAASITVQARSTGIKVMFYFNIVDENSYIPANVEISGKNEANVGEIITLTAKVSPQKVENKAVTWSVDNTKLASIDENGNLTALAKGKVKVYATSVEKTTVKSSAFEITINSPAKEIKILNGDFALEIGASKQISKTTAATANAGFFVSPVDTTDTLQWSSSNEAVLSITAQNTQSVTVKAVGAGVAELRVQTLSGVKTSVNVTVNEKAIKVTGITVDKEVTLNVGASHKLNPQIVPANANESVTYTYSSADAKIATVDANGSIRAVAPGRTSITAKTNTGRTASCSVTVKQPASKVTLKINKPSVKKIYMAKGQTVTLKAEMAPLTTTDTLTYKSNKAKIAAVTTSGMITAKKKGTAKITVTATSGKKATITVVVGKKQVKAKKVKVKAPKTMKRGKTAKLTVSLKSAKSTDTLSFASNKPAIATVDAYGYVKAVKKGKVKITVTALSGKKATKTIKIK